MRSGGYVCPLLSLLHPAHVTPPPRHAASSGLAAFCRALAVFALVALLTPMKVHAQSDADSTAPRSPFDSIPWTDGPVSGRLGTVARVHVPEGCRFTEEKGTVTFMELTQNPTSGNEVGMLVCETASSGNPADVDRWFVVFEYDASGYVKDDEKTKLDGDKILATLREGQEVGNEERRRRGWSELTLDGWIRPPYYDQATHNLTWATRVLSESDTSVNHSVRLLGRGGVLKADLVIGPGAFERALPSFDQMITGTTFVSGQSYSEWRDGDKVAKYGLTALVAGGAGAAAMKLGLFGKLWKVIGAGLAAAGKVIVAGVVAVGAAARSFFRKRRAKEQGEGAAG